MTDNLDDTTTAVVIRDLAIQAEGAEELEPGIIYAWLSPKDGQVQMVDLTKDDYLPEPKRKKCRVDVYDVPSFMAYWAKHHLNGETELYADTARRTVTAVLNAHSATAAHWQDHRLILTLRHTDQWTAWRQMDRQWLNQVSFAEFLEDHISDIGTGEVTGARLLEMTQDFTVHKQVQFSSGSALRDGAVHIQYIETMDEGTSRSGEVKIPTGFNLGIVPFDDAEPLQVRTRLRYRIQNRQLVLGYFMEAPDEIVREAVKGVVAKIAELTGETVMTGAIA